MKATEDSTQEHYSEIEVSYVQYLDDYEAPIAQETEKKALRLGPFPDERLAEQGTEDVIRELHRACYGGFEPTDERVKSLAEFNGNGQRQVVRRLLKDTTE